MRYVFARSSWQRTDDLGMVVGRGSRIRTGGLPLPKRTRYQAAPYPVMVVLCATMCRDPAHATTTLRLHRRGGR